MADFEWLLRWMQRHAVKSDVVFMWFSPFTYSDNTDQFLEKIACENCHDDAIESKYLSYSIGNKMIYLKKPVQ